MAAINCRGTSGAVITINAAGCALACGSGIQCQTAGPLFPTARSQDREWPELYLKLIAVLSHFEIGKPKYLPMLLHQGEREFVTSLSFSPDGTALVVRTSVSSATVGQPYTKATAMLRLWDTKNGDLLHAQELSETWRSLSFSADKRPMLSPDWGGAVVLYPPRLVNRSPNGQLSVAFTWRGVRIERVRNGRLLRKVPASVVSPFSAVAFLTDDRVLLLGMWGQRRGGKVRKSNVEVWNIATGRRERSFPSDTIIHDFALSPNRRWLATVALVSSTNGIIGSVISMFDHSCPR